MARDNDDEDFLAPEDDWDLPQPPRPRAPADGQALAAASRPASGGSRPTALIAASATSHPAATTAEALRATSAAGAPSALAHADKPNLFPALAARSALFRVGRPSAHDAPHRGPIPAQGDYGLTLSGPWPRMRDKAVWETAMQLAKERANAAEPFQVGLSEIAGRMGLSDTSGGALDSIWSSLERLAACVVEFQLPTGARCQGSLLKAATKMARAHFIQVDMALAEPLFHDDYQFKIDGARRANLGGSLAQWLHDFLSTHEQQERPLTLGYLRDLCGYDGPRKGFPELLRIALAELADKVPELLQSHALAKRGRSSDGWGIELRRGTERPSFAKPRKSSSPSESRIRKGPRAPSRKSGPAL